jgi:hypothetical protein
MEIAWGFPIMDDSHYRTFPSINFYTEQCHISYNFCIPFVTQNFGLLYWDDAGE